MKEKLKGILGNGLPYGLTFFVLSFLLGYYSFNLPLQKTLLMSTFLGVGTLLLNGFIYSRFAKPLKTLENITFSIEDAELLILEGAANHRIQDSMVPGKLFITNKRLIFIKYEIDGNKSLEYCWEVNSLKPVKFYLSIWNSGGEFLLKTEDEIILVFEVNKLKPWKEVFKEALYKSNNHVTNHFILYHD